jgi:hypothetical protein
MSFLGLRFKAFAGAYSLQQEWDRFRNESNIAGYLTKHVARNALGATSAVLLITALDWKWTKLFHAPEFARELTWIHGHFPPLSPEAYTNLLATIAGTTGVFLGLYFTALTVVMSSMFSTDSPEVRAVIVEEQVSNTYLRTLTALLSFSLTALALQAMGFKLGRMLLLAIATLSILGIFSFLLLGLQAFMFFDYTRIIRVPLVQILENAKSAASILGKESSLQAHFRMLAAQSLKTIRLILWRARKEIQTVTQPLVQIIGQCCTMLSVYQDIKLAISPESLWYAREHRFKNWFFASGTEIEMAAKHSIPLRPEEVPNPYWVEDACEDAIIEALRTPAERQELEALFAAIEELRPLIRKYADGLEIVRCVGLVEKISSILTTASATWSPTTKTGNIFAHALYDQFGLLLEEAVLGLFGAIDSIKARVETNEFRTYNKPAQVPFVALARVETVFVQLAAEKAIEGQFVSSEKSIEAMVLHEMNRVIFIGVEALLGQFRTGLTFAQSAQKAGSAQGAAFAHRCLVAIVRTRSRIQGLEELIALTNDIRPAWDVPWSKWDFLAIRKTLDEIELELNSLLAALLPKLINLPQDGKFPDIFGQTYNQLCNAIYSALCAGDESAFGRLFPSLIQGVLAAHNIIRERVKDSQPDTAIAFVLEPWLDVMDLSGYAYAYSELHEKPGIWTAATQAWDKILGTLNAEQLLNLMFNAPDTKMSAFSISPRDVLRTSWSQQFSRMLEERGLASDSPYGFAGIGREAPPTNTHPSQFINRVSRSSYMFFWMGRDLFLAVYLSKRPEAKGRDYRRKEEMERLLGEANNEV